MYLNKYNGWTGLVKVFFILEYIVYLNLGADDNPYEMQLVILEHIVYLNIVKNVCNASEFIVILEHLVYLNLVAFLFSTDVNM